MTPLSRTPIAALALLIALGLVFAGCIASEEEIDTPMEPGEEIASSGEPLITEHTSSLAIAVGTPVLSLNNGDAGSYSFELPAHVRNNITGFVLELTWDAVALPSETLDLWVRAAGAGALPPSDPSDFPPEAPIAKITGTSPLRIVLGATDIPDDRAYEGIVRASSEPAGLAAEQPFVLTVVAFQGIPFDAEWHSE